jgi:hypothetical protein
MDLNYWGVHPVARVSSNVNKPPYATMFGARFIVHSHYMFLPRSEAIFRSYVTKYILRKLRLCLSVDINVATSEYILSHST